MQMNTPVAGAVDAACGKEQYDAQVKKLLSNKQILAWILKYTTEEFKDYPIAEIMEAIEGTPEVGTVPVYPGLTNVAERENIIGMPNEDSVPNEGKVMFDIRCYALTREKEKVKLIINVEAQKDYYPGYDLVTRGIFYCARMLSAQLDIEFTAKNYDDMKKVYSIWICMNAPDYAADTITEYRMMPNHLIGEYNGRARYDLLSVVMVRLGRKEPDEKTPKLQRMLSTLLSRKLKPREKCKILNEDFAIQTMQEVEGGTNLMCNLSDLIEEEGIAKGVEKGIAQERENGIRLLLGAYKEGGLLREIAFEKLKEKYELPAESAEQYMKKYWK